MIAAVAGVLATHAAEPATDSLKLIPPWTAVTAKASKSGVEDGVWGWTQKFNSALTGQSLVLQAGRLTVPLPPMRMRMVWIE